MDMFINNGSDQGGSHSMAAVFTPSMGSRNDLGIRACADNLNRSYGGKNLGFPRGMCDCSAFSMAQQGRGRGVKRQKRKAAIKTIQDDFEHAGGS